MLAGRTLCGLLSRSARLSALEPNSRIVTLAQASCEFLGNNALPLLAIVFFAFPHLSFELSRLLVEHLQEVPGSTLLILCYVLRNHFSHPIVRLTPDLYENCSLVEKLRPRWSRCRCLNITSYLAVSQLCAENTRCTLAWVIIPRHRGLVLLVWYSRQQIYARAHVTRSGFHQLGVNCAIAEHLPSTAYCRALNSRIERQMIGYLPGQILRLLITRCVHNENFLAFK